jgi:type 2 lantibiotic biosynthesis protein LanM
MISHALAVGDRLATMAALSSGRAGWNGMSLAGRNKWHLRPTGSELYDGTAGIVLFLAYLAAVSGQSQYRDLAGAGAAALRDRFLRAPQARGDLGLFSGHGGLVYLCAHLFTLWGDDRYAELADVAVQRIIGDVDDDRNYDVIGGAAGCIAALLALSQVTASDRPLLAAVRCGDHLVRTAHRAAGGLAWPSPMGDAPLAGFSHGAAGIAWALLMLSRESGDRMYAQTAAGALGYERGLFDARRRNWADLRTFDGLRRNPDSTLAVWCHGAAGIGLSRTAMLPDLDGDELRTEITHAVDTTLETGFGDNHSLCHGDLGNLDILFQIAEAFGDAALRQRAVERLRTTLDDIDQDGLRCGIANPAEIPGLMTGLAGVGFGMLRLADPGRVPSVLLASPPVRGQP